MRDAAGGLMNFTKSILSTGIISAGVLCSIMAEGQNSGMTQNVSAQDYVTQAGIAGKTEVAAARVAFKNSQADDVKSCAKHMIKDHSQANKQLASIAKRKGLAVPAQSDAKHRAILDALRMQTGAAFDARYANPMVADHEEAVGLFGSEAVAGEADADLSAFARQMLPTLEHHKSMADALASQHGGP
jgi:putative membrane protein